VCLNYFTTELRQLTSDQFDNQQVTLASLSCGCATAWLVCVQEGRAAVNEDASQVASGSKREGHKVSADAGSNLVFAMHGAIRRAMRLSMHGAWNLQLAADSSARDQLSEVCTRSIEWFLSIVAEHISLCCAC
jgi:hypothetical protein